MRSNAYLINQTEIRGLTANISFDEFGFRQNFTIDIVEMTINNEMAKVGFSLLQGRIVDAQDYVSLCFYMYFTK